MAFTTAADASDFMLAGNAIITLESRRTGSHFTYRVHQATDRETSQPVRRWFVSLLTGPDNTGDYTYIGLLDERGGGAVDFRLTAASKVGEDAASVAGFRYMWRWLTEREAIPPEMAIRHEGRCGRCGRTLTVPESLERGIGPECAKHPGAGGRQSALAI